MRNISNRIIFSLLFSLSLSVQAAPAVVTTIKPLHLLASELMAGIGEPELLLNGQSDPHHYSMKLSERRMLANADIMLWIGPDLELPLTDLITQLDAEIITASELALPRVIDHDPHLWLDADNVIVIAEALVIKLMASDPDNRDRYQQNLDMVMISLQATDVAIADMFKGNNNTFAVYHDAFSYFEQRYGLAHSISLTGHEDVSPGVRQIQRFRALAEEEQIRCLLIEPGVDQGRLNNLLNTDGITIASIDPVWHGMDVSNHYAIYLTAIAVTMNACLNGEAE